MSRAVMLTVVILVAVIVAGVVTTLVIVTTSKPGVNTPIAQSSNNATVPSAGATTAPVSSTFGEPAAVTKGVTAMVTKMEAVQGEANLPGEIAGPAVRATITITNDTASSIALDAVVVNAYYGTDRVPALNLTSPGGKPFGGSIPAGKSATGVYVFNVPLDQRSLVSVELSYSADTALVAFSGAVPQ